MRKPVALGADAMVIVASLLRPLIMDGNLPIDLDRGFQAVVLALLLGAARTRRPSYHQAVALMATAPTGAYMTLLFARLRWGKRVDSRRLTPELSRRPEAASAWTRF